MNSDKQKPAGKIIRWKVRVYVLALLTLFYGGRVFSASLISHPWRSVYGSFYNGNFYLGVGNSFAVLPGASGPFHLTTLLIRNTLKLLLMSGGILGRSFRTAGSIKYTHGKMVDCSPHDVAIEDPVLRSLLSIQSGCINETEPLWVINAAPVWPFSIPGFDARRMSQVPLYNLNQLMQQHRLSFISLQPSRAPGSPVGQVTGVVTAYTCTHYGSCFAIEFDFAMGGHKWLLEELLVRSRDAPWPVPWQKNSSLKINSVFTAGVINPVINGLSCLLEHTDSFGQQRSCRGNHRIIQKSDFSWRYISRKQTLLSQKWLYAGAGYRILPLQPCNSGAGKNIWKCPQYLVWSQDHSSRSAFAESMPVLSIAGDHGFTDYQARYFDYDLRGIGTFHRSVNHADRLLKYLVSLSASLSLFADSYDPEPAGALVPVQSGGQLLPLMNIAITSSLYSRAELMQTLKKDMEPLSLPIQKPTGRTGAANPGQGMVSDGRYQQARVPGSRRGQGYYLYNGSGGRDNGGFRPPYPGSAKPYVMANRYDVHDMLRQLFRYGFRDNLLPLTSNLAAAITETTDGNSPEILAFKSRMQLAFMQQATTLEKHLTQPVGHILYLLISGQFDPLNINQVITLSELTGQDLLIFLASAPGLHGYKYYRRGSLDVISGELNNPLPEVDRNTLVLAYNPDPHGFKRMGLPENKNGRILPLGVDEVLLSYRLFMPPFPTTDTDMKGLINNVLQEYYSDANLGVLHQSRQYLARAGLLSFCPVGRIQQNRFFYSKTLLENIEWFWQNNRKHLMADQALFFRAVESSKIEKELRTSSRLRFNPSIGQVGESEFDTLFFLEMALPLMGGLVESQHRIVGILMDVLKEHTFFGSQGWRAAIYGGAATRSHLLVHRFMGDLDLAVRQGVMSVNDVDVMVSSEAERNMLVTLLKDHLRREMPSLNIKEVTRKKEHLHTHILKICYDWARVFSIDISYSDKPDYYDFSGVTLMELPAFQGARGVIKLPVIGLKSLLNRMVQESSMPEKDKESARRRNNARWNLELFAEGDGTVKAMLKELMPPKPDLPDVIPKEANMARDLHEIESSEEPQPGSIAQSPEPELVSKPVISLIRTQEFLDVEEKPDWSEQLTIVPYASEPDPVFTVDVKEKSVESETVDGTVSLFFSGATVSTRQTPEPALTYSDLYQILPLDEAELPGITDSDMSLVSTRMISDSESGDSHDKAKEISGAETPEESRLEILWPQSYPVRTYEDLYSDRNKLEPLLGWATFPEEVTEENIYLGDKFVSHLLTLQARVTRTGGNITVLLSASGIKNIELANLSYSIPDYAYLNARTMPWHINGGRLLLTLYRARYFHQAFPYLAAILGDPRSRLFQPASLVKMAKEFRKSAYPVNRRYELAGDLPDWPEPDEAIKEIADLLMAGKDEQAAMLKAISRRFLNDLEQGYFHAGLGMVILQLGGFSKTQKNFLVSRIAYGFDGAPGARWLLSSLQTSGYSGPDDFYLFRQWQAFRNRYKKDIADVTELKEIYGQFRSLIADIPENDEDYLPEQLMVLDDPLYMSFAWLAKNMRAYNKRNAGKDDSDGYDLLGRMMLSVYFHLEQNLELMMDLPRLQQFRALAKIRGELDKNYSHSDLIDRKIVKRFLVRLVRAWTMTKNYIYVEFFRKMLLSFRDENSVRVLLWFGKELQKKQ